MRIRRYRYRRAERIRYQDELINWLADQSLRLGVSADVIIARLQAGETSFDIEATPTPAPPDPDPTPSDPTDTGGDNK